MNNKEDIRRMMGLKRSSKYWKWDNCTWKKVIACLLLTLLDWRKRFWAGKWLASRCKKHQWWQDWSKRPTKSSYHQSGKHPPGGLASLWPIGHYMKLYNAKPFEFSKSCTLLNIITIPCWSGHGNRKDTQSSTAQQISSCGIVASAFPSMIDADQRRRNQC